MMLYIDSGVLHFNTIYEHLSDYERKHEVRSYMSCSDTDPGGNIVLCLPCPPDLKPFNRVFISCWAC
jgi:hypothetical protein